MNSKDFPKGYKPIVVYVPANIGIYTAKITVGEDYEKIDWIEADQQGDNKDEGWIYCPNCGRTKAEQ